MKISFLKLLFASILFISPFIVLAGNAHNLSGFAWSSNIGWISMNNTSGGGAVDYGVHKNPDGTLTGNAWSDNIGWIKFGGLSNFPTGNGTVTQNARVNSAGTGLEGWARACAGMSDPGNCVDVVTPVVTPPGIPTTIIFDYNAPATLPSGVTSSGNGQYSWTVPTGATSVQVKAWGGGGKGGNGGGSGGGAGGGGGGYRSSTLSVTPGNSYSITIGKGGSSIASAGGNSVFANLLTVNGAGGGMDDRTSGGGGIGGIGDLNGGAGGNGAPGGVLGTSGQAGVQGGPGGNAGISSGGGGGAGGSGGGGGGIGGGPLSKNGGIGIVPGGGGGGGEGDGSLPFGFGGNGAAGRVIITYTAPPPPTKIIFDYGATAPTTAPGVTRTGAGQYTWTVPENVTLATVKMWGAGGGNVGGGGGFSEATVSVNPGESLSVLVGGGGQVAQNGAAYLSGGGGGKSSLSRISDTLLVAGGGGGGVRVYRYAQGSTASLYFGGGAGGGQNGQNAQTYPGWNSIAGGGTQTLGGVGGGGGYGASGSLGLGGNGYGNIYLGQGGTGGGANGYTNFGATYGAGGGGGYYGGGGGGGNQITTTGNIYPYYTGGGGGSGFIKTGATGGSTVVGNFSMPGNSTDPDRGTTGAGGGDRAAGQPGRVIISYTVTPPPAPTPLDPRGGWDGWISLKGTTPNYGVNFTEGGDFSGYAWGSDVVGWVDFDRVIGPNLAMSGTLTSSFSTCTIASGQSNCSVDLSWSINNPEADSTAITFRDVNNNIISIFVASTRATPQFSTLPVSVSIPYPSKTFYLYNNNKSLIPTSPNGTGITVTASCTTNTSWNGTQCVPSALDMDLRVSREGLNGEDHGSGDPLHVEPGERIYFTWTSSGNDLRTCYSLDISGSSAPIANTQVPPGIFIYAPQTPRPQPYSYSASCTQTTAMRTIDKFVSFFIKPAFADASDSDTVYVVVDEPVVGAPVAGACGATHYDCLTVPATPSPIPSRISSPSRWTWTCPGINNGADRECSERKRPGFIED